MSAGAPGVIIAAPASGCGKTLATLALLRVLRESGVAVASAKTGPDYIDPAFHAGATGQPCCNLDPWAMRRATLASLIQSLAAEAELIVCEGVMGLFDGARVGEGSTADLAALTGWPVILIVDARAQAASAAAVVLGFARFRPDIRIAGVIFNRVGSEKHAAILREACELAVPDVAVLGCLPWQVDLALPERHLGLVQAGEHPALHPFLERAAAWFAAHVDPKAILSLAKKASVPADPSPMITLPPLGQRISIADDVAFAFRYSFVLEGWRSAGCEIRHFSPLADQAPDKNADAIYLPGGYPELYAGRLAANRTFMEGLRSAAARGATVFGECGGYMVLGQSLIAADGEYHRMAGLLALETSFASRRLHLGYRRATLTTASWLGPAGTVFRGHEFHYASVLREGPGQPLFKAADVAGNDGGWTGLTAGPVAGSFIHLIDREDA